MAESTGIEWCDATFNPWIGCMKVSPVCDHCYAVRQDAHRKWTPEGWGGLCRCTGAELWKGPAKWNAQPFAECMGCRWRGEAREAVLRDSPPGFDRDPGAVRCCPKCQEPLLKEARRRVFCASLADVFDNEVDTAWRDELMGLIVSTPNLDWLLLTKRIGNVSKMLKAEAWQHLQHVWLGATVVTQEEADRDVPKLLAVPARVRFLSIEPMLGPVDLRRWTWAEHGRRLIGAQPGLDWVIAGGESGAKARPAHPEWFAQLRNQCKEAGVPFLFKQWGEWMPEAAMNHAQRMRDCGQFESLLVKLDGTTHWIDADDHPQHDASDLRMVKVGKAAAGRLLDGGEHNGFPA